MAGEPIFTSKNYRNVKPQRGWVTGAPLEPLTTALDLVGATRVDAKEFRTLGGNFELGRLVEDGDFTAWELLEIKARAGEDCRE